MTIRPQRPARADGDAAARTDGDAAPRIEDAAPRIDGDAEPRTQGDAAPRIEDAAEARADGEAEARVGLNRFNARPVEAACQALLACCSSSRWAAQVAAARPYASVDAALRRCDEAVAGLANSDLAEALSGHPRIGEVTGARPGQQTRDQTRDQTGERTRRPPGEQVREQVRERPGERPGSGTDRWSRQEQAGVSGADLATRQELAAANAAYERRFGHLYLVCATGKSAAELLGLLHARLANDPAAEWRVVRAELGKINRIRLRALIEGAV